MDGGESESEERKKKVKGGTLVNLKVIRALRVASFRISSDAPRP
jgi:hypothetical protein